MNGKKKRDQGSPLGAGKEAKRSLLIKMEAWKLSRPGVVECLPGVCKRRGTALLVKVRELLLGESRREN